MGDAIPPADIHWVDGLDRKQLRNRNATQPQSVTESRAEVPSEIVDLFLLNNIVTFLSLYAIVLAWETQREYVGILRS